MNPHACLNIIDPIDGSALCFKKEKIIFPGITYKRFFTFRIPNNLLDSECNDHALSKHVELPRQWDCLDGKLPISLKEQLTKLRILRC